MARREDIELELVLNDPVEARRYIERFDWSPLESPPPYIILDFEQRIYLDDMNDEEAVAAAKIILNDIEIPSVMREKRKEENLWGFSGH